MLLFYITISRNKPYCQPYLGDLGFLANSTHFQANSLSGQSLRYRMNLLFPFNMV